MKLLIISVTEVIIVLNNVNLRLEQGKITGIIGRNGSGKTVLLKIICGLYVATSGEVYINGNLLNHEKLDKSIGILIDNGFLTGEEQFISLLTFLTIRIIEKFNFLKIDKLKLVSCIIYENKNYKFLLAKKYIGNNDNIPYYQNNIRKFIIDGFLENAYELINESKIINDFFLTEKIKLSDKIQDTRKIQKIILLLQKLAYANKEDSKVILLFKNMNHLKLSTTDKFQLRTHYKHAWENIINNYTKNNKKMEKDNLYI